LATGPAGFSFAGSMMCPSHSAKFRSLRCEVGK